MGKSDPSRATSQAKLQIASGRNWELVLAEGAGPFISRIVHRLPDGSLCTWLSRPHRKCGGIRRRVATVWNPTELGWWISVLFMIGSSCFALASLVGIAPHLFGTSFQQPSVLNAVFFSGSIFFTSAAYLQLLEAANADRRKDQASGETPVQPFCWLGWQPKQIGWLAAFIQFIGTLLFNMNTADAMLPDLNWMQQNLLIWTPDLIGSICFLLASWLAVPGVLPWHRLLENKRYRLVGGDDQPARILRLWPGGLLCNHSSPCRICARSLCHQPVDIHRSTLFLVGGWPAASRNGE